MGRVTLHFHLITPEKELFSGKVSSIVFPGESGLFGVKEGHAPLVSSLRKGVIKYTTEEGQEESELRIERGVVEVLNNVVTACVEQ